MWDPPKMRIEPAKRLLCGIALSGCHSYQECRIWTGVRKENATVKMCVKSGPEIEENLRNKKGATIANFEIGKIRHSEVNKNGKMVEESAETVNSATNWHANLVQIGKTAILAENDDHKNVESSSTRKK